MNNKTILDINRVPHNVQKNLDNALKNAYSPYSKIKVACVLLFKDKSVISGCNIENSSYSCTICAERCAIFNAVSQKANLKDVQNVYIKCDQENCFSPCGACRQVMAEFLMPSTIITMLSSKNKKMEVSSLEKLLPNSFSL